MHFTNDIDAAEPKTGLLKIEVGIKNQKYYQYLETSDSIRNVFGRYTNFDDEPVDIYIGIHFTVGFPNLNQIIKSRDFQIPARSSIYLDLEFNSLGVSDIDSTIVTGDNTITNPYFILGAKEFRPSEGVAGGKIIIEVKSGDGEDIREIEYFLNDYDLVLDLEADNNTDEDCQLVIKNCFLWNANDLDIFEIKDLVNISFNANDCYNLKIRINAEGTTLASQRRI